MSTGLELPDVFLILMKGDASLVNWYWYWNEPEILTQPTLACLQRHKDVQQMAQGKAFGENTCKVKVTI